MDHEMDVEELLESQERYRRLVEMSPDGIVVIQDGYHVYCNRKALDLYGAESCEQLATRRAIDYIDPELHEIAARRMTAMTREGQALEHVHERIVRLDGKLRDIEAAGSPIMYRGRPAALVVIRDITERKQGEEALRVAQSRFHSAFYDAPIGMAILHGAGRFAEVNNALAALLARDSMTLVGQPAEDFVHPEDRATLAQELTRLATTEAQSPAAPVALRCVRPDGAVLWTQASMSPISDGAHEDLAPTQFLLQVVDLTARREAELQLAHQAQHDPLTGLPNRLLLMDRLQQALHRAGRRLTPVAVLFVDLDHFKDVNDSLGHEAGDQLLVQVAKRLTAALRPSDTVARLGGDEFAVCVEELDRPDRANDIARRISSALGRPVKLGRQTVQVTASIGIALSSGSEDASVLLRRADAGMYTAKQRGRAQHATHSE